jgi:hypothetical protein
VENALLLVLFDYSGTELNRFELEAGQGAGVVIDDNSEMIAVSQYTWKGNDLVTESRVYDLGGKVNNSFPRLFKYAEFIDGGRYLCGYTNKGLFLGSLETNEIVLDVEAPTTSVILDVVNDGDYFWVVSSPNPRLKSGIWIYKNFSYAKYDLDGKLLSNKDQSTKQFSSARFVSSGSGVTLMIDSTEYPIE